LYVRDKKSPHRILVPTGDDRQTGDERTDAALERLAEIRIDAGQRVGEDLTIFRRGEEVDREALAVQRVGAHHRAEESPGSFAVAQDLLGFRGLHGADEAHVLRHARLRPLDGDPALDVGQRRIVQLTDVVERRLRHRLDVGAALLRRHRLAQDPLVVEPRFAHRRVHERVLGIGVEDLVVDRALRRLVDGVRRERREHALLEGLGHRRSFRGQFLHERFRIAVLRFARRGLLPGPVGLARVAQSLARVGVGRIDVDDRAIQPVALEEELLVVAPGRELEHALHEVRVSRLVLALEVAGLVRLSGQDPRQGDESERSDETKTRETGHGAHSNSLTFSRRSDMA
jgi:hypothetical protein